MRDMRRLIRRLADDGITVLLSSHLMTEVEELCNRVAIVRRGAIVYEGTLGELKAAAAGGYRLRTTDDARAAAVLAAQHGITDVRTDNGALRFRADEDAVGALSRALVEAGALILALAPEAASLEERFFALTEESA
jgi:ABC-2 type transport system ATP-binding protein